MNKELLDHKGTVKFETNEHVQVIAVISWM